MNGTDPLSQVPITETRVPDINQIPALGTFGHVDPIQWSLLILLGLARRPRTFCEHFWWEIRLLNTNLSDIRLNLVPGSPEPSFRSIWKLLNTFLKHFSAIIDSFWFVKSCGSFGS